MSSLFKHPKTKVLLLLLPFVFVYLFPFFKIRPESLLNTYPFISDDGFDWVTEGLYLKNFLTKASSEVTLPVARPPIFNLVTMADSFLWGNGMIIAFANIIALLFLVFLTLEIANIKNNFKILSLFVLILVYSPVNYVRFWLLSDSIAIALGFYAFYSSYKLVTQYHFYLLKTTPLILAITTSGLCQTYAMIPSAILLGVSLLSFLLKKSYFKAFQVSLIVFISSILYILLIKSWFNFIPHKITPANFSLLQINFNMLGFYINTWGYYFLPFIPLSYLLIKRLFNDKFNLLTTALALIIFVYMLLSFFYQWPESRFTFLFWPYLVTFSFIFVNRIDHLKYKKAFYFAFFIIIIQAFFTSVENEWQPKFKELRYSDGIFARYFKTPLVNRFTKHCCTSNDKCCDQYLITEPHSPYVQATMEVYLKLKSR